ncbi:hypothetical protein SEUCBS139899_009357 [Sporothrix eucalyptigena]|uniref:Chromo domain-containing protein n=1 Tax=Sporothrix eucalyptigena TaxID=1812306 RepID=A0ABP0AUJ3_9PEZI
MVSFFSSTSLFFGRSSSVQKAPTPGTDTHIVRLPAENDNETDDDPAAAANLVVSDILNDFTRLRSSTTKKVNRKTPTPTPADKDDEDEDKEKDEEKDKKEAEETTATGRPARKRTTRAPATSSAVATPKTKSNRTPRAAASTKRVAAATKTAATPRTATKRKAADDAETPDSKRGRSAKSAPASAVKPAAAGDKGDKDAEDEDKKEKDKAATETTTPGKRGRPPQASTGAATPAKKVGRTPKVKAPPKPASSFPSGARRGRPPGSKNVTSTVSTHPLTGRQSALKAHKIAAVPPPPKRTVATVAKAAIAATPKKRGRKPGLTDKTVKAAATVTTTGKKRGRKPKAELAEYVVESIADKRVNPVTSVVEYNVKWEGYPVSENTWEPRDNLAGCEALLKAYEKKKK